MSATERTKPLVPDRPGTIDQPKIESISDKVGPYDVTYHLSFNGSEWLITSIEFNKNRPSLVGSNVVEKVSSQPFNAGIIFRPDSAKGFSTIDEAKEVIL